MEQPRDIAKEIEIILKAVAEAKQITNFKLEADVNALRGDGFLSEFFTGKVLDVDTGKYEHVAIKKAPLKEVWVAFNSIYTNENDFYSKSFVALDKFQQEKQVKTPFSHIPQYFCGSNLPHREFLALEDLKHLGYSTFDKKEYLDRKHLEFLFKMYGKFHALSFSFKDQKPELYAKITENCISLLNAISKKEDMFIFITQTVKSTIDMFDAKTEGELLERIKKIENAAEVMKDISKYQGNYKCLTHGDCWSNNMMFKYDESGDLLDVKLIDFQLCASNSPIFDLSYFFYSGASKEDLDKIDYYLDLYYDSFSQFARELESDPTKIFPLEVLKAEWKKYALFGIIFGTHVWVGKLIDGKEINKIIEKEDLPTEKYMELWENKLDEIRKGPEFRERAKNIFLHAVEYKIL